MIEKSYGYNDCKVTDCCGCCKFFKELKCMNGKSKYFKQEIHECSGCRDFQIKKEKKVR